MKENFRASAATEKKKRRACYERRASKIITCLAYTYERKASILEESSVGKCPDVGRPSENILPGAGVA